MKLVFFFHAFGLREREKREITVRNLRPGPDESLCSPSMSLGSLLFQNASALMATELGATSDFTLSLPRRDFL